MRSLMQARGITRCLRSDPVLLRQWRSALRRWWRMVHDGGSGRWL